MEKRLLLAFILSFCVLFLWFGKNAPKSSSIPGYSQISENKEVAENLTPPSSFSKTESFKPASEAKPIESIHSLNSKKFDVVFSNIGGTIKEIVLKDYNVSLPVTQIVSLKGYENIAFYLDYASEEEVMYVFDSPEIKISKIYSLSPEDYIIKSTVQILNKMSNLDKDVEINVMQLDMSILSSAKNQHLLNGQQKSLFEYSVFIPPNKIQRKGNAYTFSKKETKTGFEKVEWVGFRDQYFCLFVQPLFETLEYNLASLNETNFQMSVKPSLSKISSGESVEISQRIFLGPQNLSLLKTYNAGFEKIMAFSGFALVDGISKFIYYSLFFLNKIIPNWGVCIILFGILVYLLTYPLTLTMMSSMKKMQALQPHIAVLKEKNKNNSQKMNKELMELYKEHKINPLGGCLPFILQMPIFTALYQVLWRSVFLKGATFLWMKDLSEPDRLFIFPFSLLGTNEFNLLPILLIGIVFLQQRLSSKNMVVTDPAQATQQKIMGIFMPVFMGIIFYKMASGLTLYFVVFYAFSTWTQWKISKKASLA